MEDYFSNQPPKTEVRYYELHGPELAEAVVKEYQTGGLGLGVLLRCFKAWIGYKIHK